MSPPRRGRRVRWGGWTVMMFVAISVLAVSGASAQLAERQGTADGTVAGAKDVSGRSVKDPRVRIVHTEDRSLEGGSRYLQDSDPWLAYQRGKNLTQRQFAEHDGVFGRSGSFFEPKLLGDDVTPRLVRDHVNSCGMCHTVPFREPGSGGNIPKGSGEGRNIPHFFGAGLIEMIGLQTRLKVLAVCDPARRGFVRVRETPSVPIRIAPTPGAEPIDYGWCTDRDGDGTPDLNNIFRVWYVDEGGRRVFHDGNGDGEVDLRDPDVAGYNLEMMVFGWGETQGGMASTLRAFFNDPIDTHTGMQAYDPTIQFDDGRHADEHAGDGLSAVSNAGARQFAIHAPADRGLRLTETGLSEDDPDGDGVINEISEGDVDLAEWYMLNAPRPGVGRTTARTRAGRAKFDQMGCASCHTPDWRLEASDAANLDPYRRFDGDRRFFDLRVEYRETTERLEGTMSVLSDVRDGTWIPRRESVVVHGVFSDFRHHDLGVGFYETLFNGSRGRRFRTAPLWGVGTTAPYGHDGASLTLDAVIRRHGGEAADASRRYREASEKDRGEVIAFLESLILYQSDRLPTDLDGDGAVNPRFVVSGRATGEERFNPEWMFRVPCLIEGPIVAPDGTEVLSHACVNAPEAYGETLAWLRDSDGDGFSDEVDPCPERSGYQQGCWPTEDASSSDLQNAIVASGVSLAVDPRNPRMVWAAGTDGWGVRRSGDRGHSWRAIDASSPVGHATTIAVDPSQSDTLYVGTPDGVARSFDRGASWSRSIEGMSDTRVFAVAVNPRAPGTVYAAGFDGQVYRSHDHGTTWTAAQIASAVYRTTSLAVDDGGSNIPHMDNRPMAIYAGTSGGGVFRSDDGGRSWTRLVSLMESTVYTVTVDPLVPTTVFAGTAGGLFRSGDRGETWESLGPDGELPVLSVAIGPTRPATIVIGTPDGILVTRNGGKTWQPIEGIAVDGAVVAIVLDPWNPRLVHAAIHGGRVLSGWLN